MNRVATGAIVAALIGAALAGGYWWGAKKASPSAAMSAEGAIKSERKILYYRNPMGLPDTSPVPKKAPDGMDYVPVYAEAQGAGPLAKSTGKILYYRNPMGLPDTSPVPKKDPMGMDYVPVYEGQEPTDGSPLVKIDVDKVQKLGVRTEAAAVRELTRTVRAVGVVQANERGLYTVAPRFEGWIQKLHVNTTGQTVKKGQPLMDVYSPDLITAQQEYLIAVKGMQSVKDASPEVLASMHQLMESGLQRLRNWDISEGDLKELQQQGKVRQYVTLRSQANGVVLEKPSIEGKRFMAGEMLYQIADLSTVWIIAEVFEQELGLVRQGQAVKIRVDAYPDKVLTGTVTFMYPTVTAETRTAKVRIELPNPGGLLKPSMYARVEMASTRATGKALAVPDSAVLDTGTRQLVLIRRDEGRFEPRTVKVGMRADGYVEVLEGLKAGENVVVSANFLIDAESNLKAAISGMSGMAIGGAKPAASEGGKPAAPPPPSAKDGKPMADMPMTPASKPGATQHKGH